ncbi:MAG: lipid-A-disaccharide synthase, partial [Bradyrhizobium sp.]|nr:lipid-A-disaccharide synthase [Bradyrhizobium sp.]
LQDDCSADKLAGALQQVLADTPLRRRQSEAFARLDAIMAVGQASPSVRAADLVLATMRKGRGVARG